ncbi:3-phenylpropionate/trans-cinnamate dioxygenase ferredoxin reductase subunit [Amycolatopsis echigonensis]|uniref:3-phenylpropionate/trans-cinnamate dioxygenase ferredoxin reductase subunit n=1 Tax=Amycolatopsis echigonensis TaxID=2576905 RepID=A0A2N3X178_9PSEU|nr:FAD-dependent oxidoreductase [Amycolatopsis niigatensis]PKV99877.1 3-phenylpropionate/trans-cinnamate dioxygenase ferredoxin reductase subunit [Amycolatopsis niigatensis]
MAPQPAFVIVGAGLAGAKAAEALREQGFDGRIVLVGDEEWRPYERPPLSKDYLQGKAERDSVFVHDADWYPSHDIDLRLGTAVQRLDRDRHEVILADGDRLPYDKLLLTTGAEPRRLPIPGADAEGVYYLRRVEDSDRLREVFTTASRIAVIGAGWIGLEVAAAARTAGVAVTVVEVAALPLLRVLGPQVAPVFADLHRAHDVDLRLDTGIQEITTGSGTATGLRLTEGSHIEADAVVVGVGAAPNTQLAADAGMEVDNGIVVDASLRSSDPDIYAAGDVARAYHPFLGKHIRVEHWANALNQPATAAAAMLGQEARFEALPYFYTDQYDLGMEYTGYTEPEGYDQVVIRGDLSTREFIAFWFHQGQVLAGMNVNIWDVTDDIKALIHARTPVDTARLADPSVPLAEVGTTA